MTYRDQDLSVKLEELTNRVAALESGWRAHRLERLQAFFCGAFVYVIVPLFVIACCGAGIYSCTSYQQKAQREVERRCNEICRVYGGRAIWAVSNGDSTGRCACSTHTPSGAPEIEIRHTDGRIDPP